MSAIEHHPVARLLDVSAGIVRAETVASAIESTVEMAETAFDAPVFFVWGDRSDRPVGMSTEAAERFGERQQSILALLADGASELDVGEVKETADAGNCLFRSVLLVRVDETHVLSLFATAADAFDQRDKDTFEGIGTTLEAALDRIDEDESRKHERRFQSLLEDPDNLVGILDTDGTVLTANETALAYVDTTHEDVAGDPFWETPWWTHSAELQADLRDWIQRAADGEYVEYTATHPGADGETHYVSGTIRPVTDTSGSVESLVASGRDVTERRRQRRRTELFVEESNDVVSILDEDGTFTYVSGSANRVLGYDADELRGEDFFEYIHPDEQDAALAQFSDVIDEKRAITECDARFRASDGNWLNIEARCRNMNDSETTDGLLLYLRDVTQQQERTRRLNAIFNGTFQFTGLLEPDGTVLEVNDSALDFGGFERESVVGERFQDVSWWTHSEEVNARVRDSLERAADGEFVRYETQVHGQGGMATVDFSAKPITDEDGDVTSLIVEGRDITAQRQRRQHMEVLQRVMRHNMRNDLTKVRGWAQIMAEEPDADERTEQFDTIAGILDKWGEMTEKLKQIQQAFNSERASRVEADPQSVVEEAVSQARDTHSATIEVSLEDTGTAKVSPHLTGALRELIDNGVHAGRQGDAHIEVSLSCRDDDWLELAVSDTGPGMPEAEAEVLETGTETQLTHGSGLGLWLVRMLVKQAGGDITVDADAGTTVRVQMPTNHAVGDGDSVVSD